MAKYVGNSQYDRPKRDFSEKMGIAAEGLAKGIEAYGKIKQTEVAKQTLANPKSTPIEKAMALASIGQEKLGTEIFKKSANDSTLSGIEERLRNNLGVNPAEEATRDRSWRPEIAQQETTAQPGAEGTGSPTQPGFSVGSPQAAARNATALDQQAPNMNGGVPQGGVMPQAQQQVDPQREAAAYEQAAQEAARAGNHPVATQYANKAKEINKGIRDAENRAEKKILENRSFALATNKDYMSRVNDLKTAMPLKSQALSMAESAVMSGKVGPWTGNNLAKITGIDAFQDASGASLNLAIKQNLLSTLSQVSARATNKWLEQVALNAFAGVGKPEEANQTILEALKTEKELSEAEIAVRDKVLAEDVEQTGAERPYLQQRVDKILEPIQKNILEKGSFKTRVVYEKAEGYDKLKNDWNRPVPRGTPLTPQMGIILLQKTGDKAKAAEYAKQLGYTIYPATKIREYEQ